MQKIKFIVDSPSDIADEDLLRYNIDMLHVPIAIDGQEYMDRKSFSSDQFYTRILAANEIPTTSRVPAVEYAARYAAAWQEGYTDVIAVTINAGGSGIYDSACMAIDQFFSANPAARGAISIHVLDSRSYSIGYGCATVQAAQRAAGGASVDTILHFLRDWFDRIEIYLACYTLDFAKKSGRITAASAFVGDVLGLRPIISLIDGETRTVEKVRGDKQLVYKLLDIYRDRRVDAQDTVYMASGAAEEYAQQLQQMLEAEVGGPVTHHKLGASIVINSGPQALGIAFLGKSRNQTQVGRAHGQSRA